MKIVLGIVLLAVAGGLAYAYLGSQDSVPGSQVAEDTLSEAEKADILADLAKKEITAVSAEEKAKILDNLSKRGSTDTLSAEEKTRLLESSQ